MNERGSRELQGQRFGLWTVIAPAESSRAGAARWRCRCEGCGDVRVVRADALRGGKTLGCASCRAPRARASLETRQRVAEAHRAGLSTRQIALSLGVSKAFVNDVLDSPARSLRDAAGTAGGAA